MSAQTSLLHTVSSFQWSEQEYEPKEILDKFGHQLPIVIVVTQGYMGKDEGIHMVASDEMYYLYGVAHQPRVVVSDSGENYFSVPLCYKEEVIPTQSNGKDGPQMTVRKMVESGIYRMFRFLSGTSHTVCRGADIQKHTALGTLEFMDTYDERFLIIHTIMSTAARAPPINNRPQDYVQDGVYPAFTLLPVYMPVAIAVALDLVDNENKRFYRTMLKFKNYVDQQGHNYDKILQDEAEIMTFDEKPSNGDYEYIHFLQFIKANKEQDNISPDGYWEVKEEETPKPRPMIELPPAGPPPQRPPKPSAVTEQSSKSKFSVLGRLKQRKKKSDKHEPSPPLPQKPEIPMKVREAPALPDTDSDDDYEEIPREEDEKPVKKPYSNIEFTPLKDRTGPVALGLDPETVLAELHKVMTDGFIPGYENFECDLNPKLPPTPPPEPEHLRPQVPNREPKKKKVLISPVDKSSPALTSGIDPEGGLPRSKTETVNKGLSNVVSPPVQQSPANRSVQPSPLDKHKPQERTGMGDGTCSSPTNPEPRPRRLLPHQESTNEQRLASKEITKGEKKTKPYSSVPAQNTPASAAAATPGASGGLPSDVTSVSQIPCDLSTFTVGDVAVCLKLLNMADHAAIFVDNQIDGQLLTCLDQEDLQNDFNFDKSRAKKLALFISGWRPKF